MKRMKNVIVCVTDECNLSCKYCFASCNKRKLDIDAVNESFLNAIPYYVRVIEAVVKENDYNKTQVIFHGGEPLLINPENYERLFLKLQQYDLDYVMQSNGTIMSDEIYKMLVKHGVRLGISIDGMASIHNKMRVDKANSGSFKRVENTISFLQQKQYKFSGLATITKQSLDAVDEIYDFFAEKKLSFDFNPVFSVMDASAEPYLITENEYADFCINIFDRWFYGNDDLVIVKFVNIINAFLGIKPLAKCDCAENCSNYFVAVDYNGDIYNCSRFVGYANYKLSDAKSDSFSVSTGIDGASDRLEKLMECKKCDYFDYCHGGCPYNALEKTGSIYEKDYFCEGKKRIYSHIYSALKNAETK